MLPTFYWIASKQSGGRWLTHDFERAKFSALKLPFRYPCHGRRPAGKWRVYSVARIKYERLEFYY